VSDTEALLLLIGVPAVVVAAVWALAWRGGPSAEKRYRPGRPFNVATVWFLANHRTGPATAAGELEAPSRPALAAGVGEPEDTIQGAVGGASDRW
jgi:hypothetical protein